MQCAQITYYCMYGDINVTAQSAVILIVTPCCWQARLELWNATGSKNLGKVTKKVPKKYLKSTRKVPQQYPVKKKYRGSIKSSMNSVSENPRNY